MAGFIILQDGRAYSAANWAYDATVEAIAAELTGAPDAERLSAWLRAQTSLCQGPGMGRVDVRELTPANRTRFLAAARAAYAASLDSGPAGWRSPEAWPGWIARFGDLIRMIAGVERDEPPEAFNPHMIQVIPASGAHAGPGWDEEPA